VEVAFSHWSASWPALAAYAVVAAAHLLGLRRLASGGLTPELRRQALIFQGGLLLALLALVSPFGYWSGVFLWVRAVQFLLLAVAATGLMVLGAPWRPLGWPRRSQRGGPRWLMARPVAVVVVANAIWIGWQFPVPFDAVRTSSAVALAYHATCLAAGLAYWLQLIGSQPLEPAATALRRLGMVIGSVVAMTVLGMVLVFGSAVLYPAYAGPAHHVMTLLDDQQLSGAVLWMGMLPPLIIVAVALLMRWLSDEESAELTADLDRLLTPRKNAWSARPGIR
jgi:cytochrome c oxidase assembly factor CtaG